jgi:hypothetical protein
MNNVEGNGHFVMFATYAGKCACPHKTAKKIVTGSSLN